VNPTDPEIPETPPATPESPLAQTAPEIPPAAISTAVQTQPAETRALLWVLLGKQGLRAGWSVLMFVAVLLICMGIVGALFFRFHLIDQKGTFTATSALFGELLQFLALLAAATVVALVERRRGNLLAFNLTGSHRVLRFVEGLVAGFAALSVLIGALTWGHWLTFGPIALSGAQIFKFAALWGIWSLLVGCVEEGIFRCYLQFTLTRGINFWWALGIVGLICGELLLFGNGNGIWGVYIMALLGLVPCLLLHLNKVEGANFWQAAWVTSTLFGFVHTGNNGENWIGIFAAAAIGFVFVVSIRVTGSAWWAIGCHAAWDWAETYFYGTPDSGLVANGHYLSSTPVGNVFWSGGTDGPEGSLLVIGVILLLLAALVAVYGRGKTAVAAASTSELAAG
jgi:hypothetical protein